MVTRNPEGVRAKKLTRDEFMEQQTKLRLQESKELAIWRSIAAVLFAISLGIGVKVLLDSRVEPNDPSCEIIPTAIQEIGVGHSTITAHFDNGQHIYFSIENNQGPIQFDLEATKQLLEYLFQNEGNQVLSLEIPLIFDASEIDGVSQVDVDGLRFKMKLIEQMVAGRGISMAEQTMVATLLTQLEINPEELRALDPQIRKALVINVTLLEGMSPFLGEKGQSIKKLILEETKGCNLGAVLRIQ